MQLSAPKNITFYIAIVLGILGLIGFFVPFGFNTFWLLFVGFVVLVAGVLLPNV